MKIIVNEQPQRFFLAAKRWEPAVGHEIEVGEYQFCAIPLESGINVSEVSSGARLIEIPYSRGMAQSAEGKEGAMELFTKIGESVQRIIEKQDNFDAAIEDLKKIAFERLGERPVIEDVGVIADVQTS